MIFPLIALLALLGSAQSAASAILPGTQDVLSSSAGCADLPGATELLNNPARFFIVSEMHGTSEAPELFGDLVCAAAHKRPVVVALEFDLQSTPALQRFLRSAGKPEDIQQLLKDDLWNPSIADGRSSVAMLNLLKRIQNLRASGSSIEIYATQPRVNLDQRYYELEMASEWVKAADKDQKAVVLILVGKIHGLLKGRADLPFEPAASHLPAADVISLKPEESGGEAWNCQSDGCHGHPLAGAVRKPRYVGALLSSPDGYNGVYSAGRPFTASPPAASSRHE